MNIMIEQIDERKVLEKINRENKGQNLKIPLDLSQRHFIGKTFENKYTFIIEVIFLLYFYCAI